MKGMNGLTKPRNYAKDNYIREGSNVSNNHPKKTLSGIYLISIWIILRFNSFSSIKVHTVKY